MSDDELELKRSVEKLKKTCRAIKMICLVCLICFAIGWALFICLLSIGFLSSEPRLAQLDEISYLLLTGLLSISLLIIALRIFTDIVAGESPFTLKQVKRLRWAGGLLLIYTALDTLLSVSFTYSLFGVDGHFGIAVGDNAFSPYIQVNIAALIIALACFGLAVIFKYGVLLQQFNDDTL